MKLLIYVRVWELLIVIGFWLDIVGPSDTVASHG